MPEHRKRRHQLFHPESESDEAPSYTLSEISTHDSNKDLWMIIHGKVYNVTSIIDEHPGGAEVLFECAGLDASEAFDDVGHSQDSIRMLKPLFVGYVKQDKLDIRHEDDDDEIVKRHHKNLSLGESIFFKNLKRKKSLKDRYLTQILLGLACITGLLYIYIIRRKEDI